MLVDLNLSNVDQIRKRKPKGLSNQYLNAVGTLGGVVLSKPIKPMHVIFKGKGTLAQNDNDFIVGGPIVNICIVYKASPKTINSNFVLKNCLFGAIKIANTASSDTDKCQYLGYGIGWKNVITVVADMSNSRHSTNKILISHWSWFNTKNK